jgi:AraC-like DNA-binding protein
VDLVRALVLSAARDPGAPGDAQHASTTARIQAYVSAHLRDPDLGPARIAAANAVSTRTLYTIYEALGTSLERSVLDQRLQGARTDLVSPGRRHHSIAAIARSWGFRNPSSFSQQFRRAFGTTPGQCRTGAP